MNRIFIFGVGIIITGFSLVGCGSQSTATDENKGNTQPTIYGVLVQQNSASTDEQCPDSSGVTLDYGIDSNGDGQLSSDEVTKQYVICNGKDADPTLVSDLRTRITEAEAELTALKAQVELNTAKAGITEAQEDAIRANTAKVSYTDASVAANTAVVANTAKVGYTDALVAANTAVGANTAKVGYTDALVAANTAVGANTAKVGVTQAQTDAIVANTAKVSFPGFSALDNHITQTWYLRDRLVCQGAGGVSGTQDEVTGECVINPCDATRLDPWWSTFDVAYEIRFGTCQRAVIAYSGVGNSSTSSWCTNCDEYDNEAVTIEYAGELHSLNPSASHVSFADTRNYHQFTFRSNTSDYAWPSADDGSNGKGMYFSIDFQVEHSELAAGKLSLTDVSSYQHLSVSGTALNCRDVSKSFDMMMGEDGWACDSSQFTANRVTALNAD